MLESKELIKICQKVLINATKKGIEVAGTQICGIAWPSVKKIFSPIVDKLKQKYPDLFEDPEEAKKAAEELSMNKELHKLLFVGFNNLEKGQNEILAALVRNDDNISDVRIIVNESFSQAGENHDELIKILVTKFQAMDSKLDRIHESIGSDRVKSESYSKLSITEIYTKSYSLQSDAMKWISAGKPKMASERLDEAREMLKVSLIKNPNNNLLLVAFGFIEKTQAQVAQLQGDYDKYVESFGEAAKYFGKAIGNDPTDVGALNGMVNIFIFNKDYDSAIKFGKLTTYSAPDYGAAFWDLAIAYEKKLKEADLDQDLIEQLIQVYHRLIKIMPNEPDTFTAKDMVHVQKRIAELKNKIKL